MQELLNMWPAIVLAALFGLIGIGTFELEVRRPDVYARIARWIG